MNKSADTQHPIHELLAKRWSPRAFADRPVEKEKLLSLLEAVRWSASCFNEQPWSYIIASQQEPKEYDQLFQCMVEGNQQWAGQAPVLMLSVAKLTFERNGKPNRHAIHDVGLASGSLTVQATALGLYVHQMAGFHVDKARETFKIPEGHEPMAMIALGYIGDPETLPDPLKEREVESRSRKHLPEFIFQGEWGKKAPIVSE